MSSTEYLSEDILDRRFVRCFAPIHIPQYLLGSIHADIRSGFITPLTMCQKLYTISWMFMTTLCFIYLDYYYIITYYHKNTILCFCLVVGGIMQYASYISNIIHARFTEGSRSIQIYLMLQKIDRILRFNHFTFLNKRHFYLNCILACVVTVIFMTGFLVHVFNCIDYPGFVVISGMGLIVIYMEVLLNGSLIYYIGLRLRFLNQIIRLNIIMNKENNIPGVDHRWTLKEDYRIIPVSGEVRNKNSLRLSELMTALKMILRAYHKIVHRFSFTVLTIVLTVFFWTLVLIEALVIGLETQLYPQIGLVTLIIWLVYILWLLISLAITSDWFIKHANGTKSLCVYALSIYQEGPFFKAAKGLLQLIDLEKPVFSVYGVFVLNAALPLKLMGIVTNNVMVLLQFTL